MVDLPTYLRHHGFTQEEFARLSGLSQGTVSKLCAGSVGISLATAAKIERVTKGEVSMAVWLSKPESGAA